MIELIRYGFTPMGMIRKRLASSGDAAEMARIQVRSLRNQGDEYYTEKQLQHLAPPDHGPEGISDKVFEGDNRYAVVAEAGEAIAGFAVVHTDDGYLSGIFVDPEYAGEGIGTELLRDLEDELRTVGVDKVTTYAALNAVEFYESCGFSRGEQIDAGTDDSPEIPAVMMEKTIQE